MSLSTNASLNFSAKDNSEVFDGEIGALAVDLPTAHVLGSISTMVCSSNAMFGNASPGTCFPLKPKGDGFGFIVMRGHSVEKISKESLSTFGCRK